MTNWLQKNQFMKIDSKLNIKDFKRKQKLLLTIWLFKIKEIDSRKVLTIKKGVRNDLKEQNYLKWYYGMRTLNKLNIKNNEIKEKYKQIKSFEFEKSGSYFNFYVLNKLYPPLVRK